MKQKLKKWAVPAAALFVMFWVIVWQSGGCHKRLAPGRTAEGTDARERRTLTVVATNVPATYTAVGTIRSRTEVQLAARLVARILAVNVRAGDRVRSGDPLVTLDDAELRTSVNQAQARASSAQAALAAVAEQSVQARSSLELATADVERYRKLAATQMVSQQKLDTAEDAFRQAKARAAQAEQSQISAQAELRAAQEALLQTETVKGYAALASPLDGVVSERLADPGDLATPGGTLVRLFDPSKLLLEAPVREGLVSRVKVGDRLPVTLEALGRTLEAEVREIVPSVDAGSRTFLVKLCLPATEGVMPGMFGTVTIALGQRAALVIPESALVRAGQLEYVNVESKGRAARVLVRTVPAGAGALEVLSGLRAGDAIILGP